MRIKLAIIAPYKGIGGGNRKFKIYFDNLSDQYFEKYYIQIVESQKNNQELSNKKNSAGLVRLRIEELQDFFKKKKLDFFYAARKLPADIMVKLKRLAKLVVNVNFTPLYNENQINCIISKTDYYKIKLLHGPLKQAYVVYNPIAYDEWRKRSKGNKYEFRKDNSGNKHKLIIGRIARAEPTKWHFLIIRTLLELQRKGLYDYGFVFVGMPKLYRWALELLLNKKMRRNLIFLPEMSETEDIARFFRSIDVFWQTSWIGESFGNVIAEAFCFERPVITDYKKFLKENGRVRKHLYDAQIELVDHKKNGYYAKYPSVFIRTLDSLSKKSISKLGISGRKKVKENYDARIAGRTLARILYDIKLENREWPRVEKFENINKVPSDKELKEVHTEYGKRINQALTYNSIGWQEKILFENLTRLWHSIELLYTLIRFILRKFGYDIERSDCS